MKRQFVLAAVIACLFILTSQSVAQDFYIGVKFGLALQRTKFEELETFYETDYGTVYGFCLGNKFLNLGLEIHYFHSDHHLVPKGEHPPGFIIERFKLNVITANFIYYFPIPVVQPYLSAGMGTYNVNVVGFGKDSSVGYNFGIGANARVTELVSVSADGKYHLVKFDLNQNRMDLKNFTWYISVNFHF